LKYWQATTAASLTHDVAALGGCAMRSQQAEIEPRVSKQVRARAEAGHRLGTVSILQHAPMTAKMSNRSKRLLKR